METTKRRKIINNMVLLFFFVACFLFATPSILYYIKHHTVLNFSKEFNFLLNQDDRFFQTTFYFVLLFFMIILYIYIIKNRKTIFQNMKKLFFYITIIALIFVIIIPFTSSDIFYYLGVGRINGQYHQNPYYTTIKEFVDTDNNQQYLQTDTVLEKGYRNYWSNTTVVYGPVWTLICTLVSSMSFGNIDIGLTLFKLLNVLIHLLSCFLIYKLTNKKIFALLYGLNPFILIEGIGIVHNDIYMTFFILLSFFILLKKKKLWLSIVVLAIATATKYFSIILLPFMIIYYFRKEKPGKRFVKCLQYGLLFMIMLGICYLFYIKDLEVLKGLFTMQCRITKNFYVIINKYFTTPTGITKLLNTTFLTIFTCLYFFKCIKLLLKEKIEWRKAIQSANKFLVVFLFILITNFQPWYIMWLFPCFMWQKADSIKAILGVSLISQFANMVFLIYDERWEYGVPFTFLFITMSLGLLLYIQKDKLNKIKRTNSHMKKITEVNRG